MVVFQGIVTSSACRSCLRLGIEVIVHLVTVRPYQAQIMIVETISRTDVLKDNNSKTVTAFLNSAVTAKLRQWPRGRFIFTDTSRAGEARLS